MCKEDDVVSADEYNNLHDAMAKYRARCAELEKKLVAATRLIRADAVVCDLDCPHYEPPCECGKVAAEAWREYEAAKAAWEAFYAPVQSIAEPYDPVKHAGIGPWTEPITTRAVEGPLAKTTCPMLMAHNGDGSPTPGCTCGEKK